MRRISLAIGILSGLLLFATGCLKENRKLTVYPDGTGKFTFEQNLKSRFGKPKEVFEWFVEHAEGLDAWTAEEQSADDDEYTIRFQGYFSDINQVALPSVKWPMQPDAEFSKTRFKLIGKGNRARLIVQDPQTSSMIASAENIKNLRRPKRKGFELTQRSIWEGFQLVEEFVLLSASGENTAAATKLTEADIFVNDAESEEYFDKQRLLEIHAQDRLSLELAVDNPEAPDEFQKEHTQAKIEWQKNKPGKGKTKR
ncbi:MAG: hypothetical protein AAF483_27695 [Planctomycetota bacterium]